MLTLGFGFGSNRRGRPWGGGTPTPSPVLPAIQTLDFGRNTRVGHGGHRLGYTGIGYLGITAGDALGHWTIDDINELVPKNGAGAFGTAPAAMSSSYVLTVTEYSDSGKTTPTGVISTVTVNTTANRYTVTGKNAGANADSNATFQLRSAITLITACGTSEVVIRDGAVINPTGADWRLRRSAKLTGFTGENHLVFRPETRHGAIIRRLTIDGQSLGRCHYLRAYQIFFQLRLVDYPGLADGINMFGTVGGNGGHADIDILDCKARSTPGDEYGRNQAGAFFCDSKAARWRVRDNDIFDTSKPIYLSGAHTLSDEDTGVTSATGSGDSAGSTKRHIITGNVIGRSGQDQINCSSASGNIITDNILYDKCTSVIPWSLLTAPQQASSNSPYNTAVQPHGDAISIDYSACSFGSVDGCIIERNIIIRGLGRDTMPFYTTPPYPNPDSSGYTPSATAAFSDQQGIWITNNDASKTTPRPGGYVCTILNPVIRNNLYLGTLARGINIGFTQNPIIEFNTCISEKSVSPLTGNHDGHGSIFVDNVSGSGGRVTRNIAAAVTITNVTGSLTTTENNIPILRSAVGGATDHANVFNSPVYGANLTNGLRAGDTIEANDAAMLAGVIAAFKAKVGGAADLGAGVYAGAYTPAGVLVT